MIIDENIIDNSKTKLSVFLNKILELEPNANLDVASAFFKVEGFSLVKENVGKVAKFRLLLGKSPEMEKKGGTLGKALSREIEEDVESLDLSREKKDDVSCLIEFLERPSVEVRMFDRAFLHGKAYIFDKLAVVGSSNFTYSGLTREGELNVVQQGKMYVDYVRNEWFNRFWRESLDFKDDLIEILRNSRFGTVEYSPFQIYVKSLYELQKDEIMAESKEEEGRKSGAGSKVELTEFQQDSIRRIFSRLEKYGSVMVADSVGLGKTYVALKVLEEFGYFMRKRYLVICPAQLKDTMWLPELKDKILPEHVLSQENLASEGFIEKVRRATGDHLEEVELIIVDESHNLRNPLSNRWENLNTLIESIAKGKKSRPKVIFMTATPISNTVWDMYWQIMLLVGLDKAAFVKENIPDLFAHFRDVDKSADPSLLNDLLNEISIRRTRDYVRKEYPKAMIGGQPIKFPERKLDAVNYELDGAYQGMYREIAGVIAEKLTMAYYSVLKYRKQELLTPEESQTLNRMMAIGGIFKTILLKRLESSVEAFRISIKRHVSFLNKMKGYLEQGMFLSKKDYSKFLKYLVAEDEDDEELRKEAEHEMDERLAPFEVSEYRKEELFGDVETDVKLLESVLKKIELLDPESDAKLSKLRECLGKLKGKSQTVVFTYYKDTLDYVHEHVSKDKALKSLRIEKISGSFTPKQRQKVIDDFAQGKIDVLLSTDILSEGQNLQTAQTLINYDLHWNPTRMIQRAGRIDRIGSRYDRIRICNFFPEDELEELLKLVNVLQNKIVNIDRSVGLDQTVLGEKIHPKVFGIVRRLKDKDQSVIEELEAEVFGGGEMFYQPLKSYLKEKSVSDLERMPDGIHSGLSKKRSVKAIFFYYKYGKDFHFWHLYRMDGKIIKNKTEILRSISCAENTPRVVEKSLQDKVYEANTEVLSDIEQAYKEIEVKEKSETQQVHWSKEASTRFLVKIVKEIEYELDGYLSDFPEDRKLEDEWARTQDKLKSISLTKKRLRSLRRIWNDYKNSGNWKKLISELTGFVSDKFAPEKEELEKFDKKKLKLVAIDFIS